MAVKKRVLLVDDDAFLREELSEQFEMTDEFEVMTAENGQTGLEAAVAATFDVIILDVDMPDMQGPDVCQKIREAGVMTPIVMLTGNDGEADQIMALDAGANDYVTKPFRFGVLLARLRAHLRSFEQSEGAVFQIGPYRFKPAEKKLMLFSPEGAKTGRDIRLTEKETNILKFLYRAGGQAVSREVLLEEVWGYNSGVTTHTLETHIYRLRQKIEPVKGEVQILETKPGGYALNLGP